MLPITAPMSAPRGAPYEANREPPLAETFISEWTPPKIAAIVVNQSTIRSWLDGWGNGIGGGRSSGGDRSLTDLRRIDRQIVGLAAGYRRQRAKIAYRPSSARVANRTASAGRVNA